MNFKAGRRSGIELLAAVALFSFAMPARGQTESSPDRTGAGTRAPELRQPEFIPSGYDAADEVFYQIMPIAWRHGQPSAGVPEVAVSNRFGNFRGMTDSLPYLKSLGITAIWMTPIFPSQGYHGYQHGPADSVNPWFGSEEEFWTFVRAAKSLGIKVYIDFVVYGLNQDAELYKAAKGDPKNPHYRSFAFADAAREKPFGYSFKTWTGDTVRFVHWDLRQQRARDQVTSWAKHWLDPDGDGDPSDGIAGFRLDHVWSTYAPPDKKAPGGWGYNIDPFWVQWKRELLKVNPRVFTFAEQAKWETWGTDLMPAHDATFTKPFELAARDALKSEQAAKLYEWMAKAVEARPNDRTFMAIVGDHDVDRLASAIGADTPATQGRAKAAAAILLLQPFPPVLYYGDEVGMLGKAGSFGSDSNDIPRREPMKWLAADAAPMPRYHALDPRTVAKQYSKDNDGRSVAEQEGVHGSLLETYRELIKLRRENIALRRGSYEPVESGHEAVWRFRRVHPEQTLDISINLSGNEVPVHEGSGGVPLMIPEYGYFIIEKK